MIPVERIDCTPLATVAVEALPKKLVAVIFLAVKSRLLSLSTIVFGLLDDVAVVAELSTLPAVVIVFNLLFDIPPANISFVTTPLFIVVFTVELVEPVPLTFPTKVIELAAIAVSIIVKSTLSVSLVNDKPSPRCTLVKSLLLLLPTKFVGTKLLFKLSILTLPATCNSCCGFIVRIPTFLLLPLRYTKAVVSVCNIIFLLLDLIYTVPLLFINSRLVELVLLVIFTASLIFVLTNSFPVTVAESIVTVLLNVLSPLILV